MLAKEDNNGQDKTCYRGAHHDGCRRFFDREMIIFKGKPEGRITTYELPMLDPTSIYACQEAAWMDERLLA